ncbi:MAG: hypothetical protein LW832_01065 [Parachlamydia sp.]|jgi:hypothetical protein|nr:hypothetical protein [Parachlamydia sp.]
MVLFLGNGIRQLLKEISEKEIQSIEVVRTPVLPVIQKMLNMITFGEFKKSQENAGITNIFHTGVILTLDDGQRILCEKNEVISMKKMGKLNPKDSQAFNVQMEEENRIMVEQLLEKTQDRMGDNFHIYTPFKHNCQHFVHSMLKANELYHFPKIKP